MIENGWRNGWRSCVDHIIRPDSPCPVCRIAELEAEKEDYEEQWGKFEEEIERLRESEEFFSGKCGDAELKILELEETIKRVENEVHRGQISTWGTTEYWLGQIKAAIAGEG